MRPRLLPTLALCSLACSAALAGLWVMSWWRVGFAERTRPVGGGTTLERAPVMVNRGVATFTWHRGGVLGTDRPPPPGFRSLFVDYSMLSNRPPTEDALLGFRVTTSRGTTSVGGRFVMVSISLWPAILLTAIPPAAWAWKGRRRRVRGFEVTTAAPPK